MPPPRLPTPELRFCGLDAGCYAYALYNWQALLGGLIALFAALYAGRYVRRQIAAGERIEAERLRRRELAARAVLPLTLTRFVEYAEAGVGLLRRLAGPEIPPVAVSGVALSAPALPQGAIADLERAVEAATDPRVVAVLTGLAAHTQMLHSVLADVVAKVGAQGSGGLRTGGNLPAWMLRAAVVHAAASALFAWARDAGHAPVEVTWGGVERSLGVLRVDGEDVVSLAAHARDGHLSPLAM